MKFLKTTTGRVLLAVVAVIIYLKLTRPRVETPSGLNYGIAIPTNDWRDYNME